MTTAREIITDALSFGLNRLSPGETLDADTGAMCLDALNHVVDSLNGAKSVLFREVITAGTVTSASGTLGSTWATLTPGVQILGATYTQNGQDIPMHPRTMAQYAVIADKDSAGEPTTYTHDGYATVYVYPVPTSIVVNLRTKQPFTAFADLSTAYGMPDGYRSGLAALLAEVVAPVLVGGISPAVARAASAARMRLQNQTANPAILRGASTRPNIITGC